MKKLLLRLHGVGDGINLWLGEGEILGMVIENEHGIPGFCQLILDGLPPKPGHMELAGKAAIIDETPRLVPDLSIAENLIVFDPNFKKAVIDPFKIITKARQLLQKEGINLEPTAWAKGLSPAQRILFELLKAKTFGFKLILLKDVGKLLGPASQPEVFSYIQELAGQGMGFICLDTYPDAIFSICNRTLAYRSGTIEKLFFGAGLSNYPPPASLPFQAARIKPAGTPVAKIRQRDWGFSISKGECVTVLDPEGRGLTGLGQAILGKPSIKWEVSMPFGRVHLIPESPLKNALYYNQSYLFNLTFLLEEKLGKQAIPRKLLYSIQKELGGEIGIDTGMASLQQLKPKDLLDLVYYRAILLRPGLCLIISPLRGLGMELQGHVLELIKKLKQRQLAIIILTAHLDRLPLASDEVLAMPRD